MELKSLQFNGVHWRISLLGEHVILLECPRAIPIELIHQTTFLIEGVLAKKLRDIVPAYHSIAVFTELSIQDFSAAMLKSPAPKVVKKNQQEVTELPICYELGLDLERIARHANLSVEEVIALHLNGTYRSLFIGFTPGFIYADGLNDRLACPRLDSPRKRLPSGAVGIGGTQTGIYSLASPGGWNIIGRTPAKIFDSKRLPPMLIDIGNTYRFTRITKDEFESWEN